LNKARAAVAAEMTRQGWAVTLSAGAVTQTPRVVTGGAILKEVDDAMYRAKRLGKNRLVHVVKWKQPKVSHEKDHRKRCSG
jgi:PleD family two-component response regulator